MHTNTDYTHTLTQSSDTPLGLFVSEADFKVVNIKTRLTATCRRGDL